MKILFSISFCIISIRVAAQTSPLYTPPFDSITHKITYSEWVKIDGAKSDEIYRQALLWFAKKSDSSEHPYPIEKQEGKIISKGYSWLTINAQGSNHSGSELNRKLFYTITVSIKNGAYQFVMSDFYFHYFPSSIFSAERDSTVESVYSKNSHDNLTQAYFRELSSTEKKYSESFSLFIQPPATKETPKMAISENMDERVQAAGDQLIISANQYYAGLGMTIGGALVDGIGTIALSKVALTSKTYGVGGTASSNITYGPSPLLPVLDVAGGILIIVGTIDIIASYSHIKKAGHILKYGAKTELGLGLTNNGEIGLTFNF